MRPFTPHSALDLVAVGPEGDKTWADLAAAASSVALHLTRGPPTEIILACEDRFHFAAGLLGAFSAHRRVVLPSNTQKSTLDALASEGERLLVHDRADEKTGHDLRSWLGLVPESSHSLPPDDEEVVIVMTSGSTGPPLSLPKTFGQLILEVEAHRRFFGVDRGARVLGLVPPHHIYGLLWGILLPLKAGASFVRRSALHGEAVAEVVRLLKVTHVVSVPAQLRALAEIESLPRVERVFSAGAPLPVDLFMRLNRAGWPVTELYGSSETGGVAFRERGDDPWRAFPGVRVGVDGNDRLTVASPFLHALQERPFVTGDLARLTDGGFELLGRWDGIVKVGGKRLSLAEVELRAVSVPGVEEAFAVSHPSAGGREQEIWLVVVGRSVTPTAVRLELTKWLDPVAVPRRIRVVEALPREENGKVARSRLLSLFEPVDEGGPLIPEKGFETIGADGREEVTRVFSLAPDLPCFEGHFPGRPVLAGISQLNDLVLRQVRLRWAAYASPRRVLRLKFKRLIVPGDHLVLRLFHVPGVDRVDFQISTEHGNCSSGTLVFGSAQSGASP